MQGDRQQNPAVAIVAVVGGISLTIVIIFAIFAQSQLQIAAWMVGALALMGAIVAPLAGRKG